MFLFTGVMQPSLAEVIGRAFQPAVAAGGVISIHALIMTLQCVSCPKLKGRGGRLWKLLLCQNF